ncbi:conjugal transfer protein TraO [uncultured Porphyromonas sp.]|uniref:conjugal transfer protein TraO n=1 Tax=uncultured Porphyromonas sp. TaxID=159274 RepID=UPI00261260B8|nr:conjugal transfer protein TraO [uncultured Porphyromonas sp.]
MRTLLNRWNTIWLRPLTDEEALIILDSYNKTRYSRRKKKEGLLELASREAHERQAIYFATILNDDDTPYCAIESNVGYFGLDFLGDKYENYLLYEYREDEYSGKLFLRVITLFECYPGTTEKKIRIDFRYTHQGGYSSLLYQGEAYDGTYEEKSLLPDGAMLLDRSRLVYGGAVHSSVECFLSDRLLLVLKAQGRLLLGSDLHRFRPALALGLRLNL